MESESIASEQKGSEIVSPLKLAKDEDEFYKGRRFWNKEDNFGQFKIHHKLKEALIDLKEYRFGYLVAVSRNTVLQDENKKPCVKQSCQFLLFRDFKDFKVLYDSMEKENQERRFLELIRYETAEEGSHNQPFECRLFFDIELKEKLFSKDEFFHPEALQDFEQIIRETLAECYPGSKIPPLEFVWSECPRPNKASYHLVIKGILFDNFKEHYSRLYHAVVFNIAKSGKFSYIPEERFKLGDVIDRKMLVNIQFRMVGCCKINSPPLRFLNPEHKLEDSLVNPRPALSVLFYEKPVFFLRDFKTDKQKEIDEFFEKQEKSYPRSGGASFVEKERLLEALQLLKTNIPWMDMFEPGDYWNNCLLYLKRTKPGTPYNCPRCGNGEDGKGRHHTMPPYITIYNGFDIIFCCGKAKPMQIAQLEMPLEEAEKRLEASKQQQKKKEKDPAIVNAKRRENHKRLEEIVPPELKRFMAIFRSRGPKGISDFYIEQKAQGKIFSYGLKGAASIFIWMERERIWTEIGDEHLMLFVGDTMQVFIYEKIEVIDNLLEKLRFDKAAYLTKALLEDDLKFLQDKYRDYDKPSVMNEIATCLVPRVHDEKLFAQLNANPYILPILGGKIIDFRTLEVRDRLFTDYCLEEVPTRYTGKISPAFLKFISDIFLDDEEIIDFMRKIVGYSITGITKEQKLFICHGSGGNGKTRFLDLIANTFGKFYGSADKGVLSNVDPGKANPSLFRIAGKRFVSIPETNRGETLNEDILKRLTGGDRITCRALYKEEIEFKPRWHLWLATNSLPNTSNDYAIERRLVLIRFNARFVDIRQEKQKMAEQKMKLSRGQPINWEEMILPPGVRAIDPDLDEKLASEEFRESMLTWAVSGAHDYLKEGLKYPKSVRDLMDAHMKQCDSVQSFLDEACMVNIGDETFKYPCGEFHKAYTSFCKEYGVVKKTIHEMTQQLKSMEFEHRETNKGNFWIGIKPIPRQTEGGSLLYSN